MKVILQPTKQPLLILFMCLQQHCVTLHKDHLASHIIKIRRNQPPKAPDSHMDSFMKEFIMISETTPRIVFYGHTCRGSVKSRSS